MWIKPVLILFFVLLPCSMSFGASEPNATPLLDELRAGSIVDLHSENSRLDLMIENLKKQKTLKGLNSQIARGVDANVDRDEEPPTSTSRDMTADAPVEDLSPRNVDQATLRSGRKWPLVTRIYGSNGTLYADLIYLSGREIPRAEPGTVLPGGGTLKNVAIGQVTVLTESGEEKYLSFVPRLSR